MLEMSQLASETILEPDSPIKIPNLLSLGCSFALLFEIWIQAHLLINK